MYQVVNKYVIMLICGSCDFVNLLKFIVCFDLFFHGLIIIYLSHLCGFTGPNWVILLCQEMWAGL